MWADDLVLLDGENEDELLDRFIELCAAFPDYPYTDIAIAVFKEKQLPDAVSRGFNAVRYWLESGDLSRKTLILDRIRKLKQEGGKKSDYPQTKDDWLKLMFTTIMDDKIHPQDKKARLDGLKTYGQSMGWIESDGNKTPVTFPQIVHGIGNFHANG